MPAFDVIPAQVQGLVRDTSRPNLGVGNGQAIGLTNGGSLLVSNDLPPKAELVRLGSMNTCRIATGSAFTFVAAWPTTRAELVLYNGEASSGKCYIIDSIGCAAITSMGAAGSIALIAQVVTGATAPTDDTAQLITPCGGGNYGGSAKRAVAQTTAIANKWELLQSSQSGGSATAQIGLASYVDVWGKFIVRPGNMFAVNVVAGTAVGTAIAQITWGEVTLNI